MQITRLYTGSDGESHFEDIEVDFTPGSPGGQLSAPVPVDDLLFRHTAGSYDYDFHCAPRRQYIVNLNGSVEIETGSGETRVLGPGSILLAEDTTGRGHKSRAVDGQPRDSLFITLPVD